MLHEENQSELQLDLKDQPHKSLTRLALTSVSNTDTTTTTGTIGLGIRSELGGQEPVMRVSCSQAVGNDSAFRLESLTESVAVTESKPPRQASPVCAVFTNTVNGMVHVKVEVLDPVLSEAANSTQAPDADITSEGFRDVLTGADNTGPGAIPLVVENGHHSPPTFDEVGSPLVFRSHLEDAPLEPNWNPYDELETRIRLEEPTNRNNVAQGVETSAGSNSFIPSDGLYDVGLATLEWTTGPNTGTTLLPEPQHLHHHHDHCYQSESGIQSWSPTLGQSHDGQPARPPRSRRVRKSEASYFAPPPPINTPPNMTMMSMLASASGGHDQGCHGCPSQHCQPTQHLTHQQHYYLNRRHPLDSRPYPDPSRRLHRHHGSYSQSHTSGNPSHLHPGASSHQDYMPSVHLPLSDAASMTAAGDVNGPNLGYASYAALSPSFATFPPIFGLPEGGSLPTSNYQDQYQQGGPSHQFSYTNGHGPSHSEHYAFALSQLPDTTSENLPLSSKNGEYPRRNLSKQELQAMDPDPKFCFNCHTRATPSWRRCPEGRILLCNACGLYQKLHGKARPFFMAKDGTIKIHRTQVEHDPCQICGATSTPIWRKGPQEENLCNACSLTMKQQQPQQHAGGQGQNSKTRHCDHQHQNPPLCPEISSDIGLSPSSLSPATWPMHTNVECGQGLDALEVSTAFGSAMPVAHLEEHETFASLIEAASTPIHENSPRHLRAVSRASDGAATSRARSTRSTNR